MRRVAFALALIMFSAAASAGILLLGAGKTSNVAFVESSNDTIVLNNSGGTIVDSVGAVWTVGLIHPLIFRRRSFATVGTNFD
jgi:hypothetical protein